MAAAAALPGEMLPGVRIATLEDLRATNATTGADVGSSAIQMLNTARGSPEGTLLLVAMVLVVLLVIAAVGIACRVLWRDRSKRPAQTADSKEKPIVGDRLYRLG
jgi:hypothetical protein